MRVRQGGTGLRRDSSALYLGEEEEKRERGRGLTVCYSWLTTTKQEIERESRTAKAYSSFVRRGGFWLLVWAILHPAN